MVKRYEPVAASMASAFMEETADGGWVDYDDYETIAYAHGVETKFREDMDAENKALSLKLPSWVKISERAPPIGKYVLCYFVGGFVCSCAYAKETYDDEPRWYSDFVARMGQLPTHWMPLPEPPK